MGTATLEGDGARLPPGRVPGRRQDLGEGTNSGILRSQNSHGQRANAGWVIHTPVRGEGWGPNPEAAGAEGAHGADAQGPSVYVGREVTSLQP